MDGFEPGASVVVMAATNRAEILDAALLRPGRFDRTVEIPLPNQKERTAILAIHAKSKKIGPDVDLDAVSRGTPGFSGADLANLVNEAAINAVRADRDILSAADFDAARDRLLIGRRDASNALLPEEKHAVAVHEAGHALVAVLSEHADPVAKVTILPRGAALGVTEQLPESERHLYPQSYLTDSLAVRLGGRAGEIIVLGEPSTGASNDLAGATELATRMVREWGFSAELGPVGYGPEGPAATTPSPAVPMPSRRNAPSTRKSPGSSGRPRPEPRNCSASIATRSTRSSTSARPRDNQRLGSGGNRRSARASGRAGADLGTPGRGDDAGRADWGGTGPADGAGGTGLKVGDEGYERRRAAHRRQYGRDPRGRAGRRRGGASVRAVNPWQRSAVAEARVARCCPLRRITAGWF